MAKLKKNDLIIDLDRGIVGTLVNWDVKLTEKEFQYLTYVPLNSILKVTLDKPIRRDHIHYVHNNNMKYKGAIQSITFIYSGDNNSLVKDILKSDQERLIEELREKVRKLKMQVASSKQSEEDARSGVNKQIASIKAASKNQEVDRPMNPFINRINQVNSDYDDGFSHDFD